MLLAAALLLPSSSFAAADDVNAPANGPPPVTFDAAVGAALERNPQIAAALADIQRAEAIRAQVRAAWLPSATVNAAYTRLDDDRRLGDRVLTPRDSLSVNLTLAVPLLAPARWVQSAQATEQIAITEQAAEDVRRALATAVGRTYLTLLAQHRNVEIAERSRQNAQAHREVAQRRFEQRYGSRLDQVRAAQEEATAAAQAETARAQLVRLQEALGVLLGAGRAQDAIDEPPLDANASLESALAEAARQRSDVELARRQVALAERIVDQDWTLFAPSLTGLVQPFYQEPPTATIPRTGWQAQLVFSLPLLEGGLRVAQRREHTALVARAHAVLAGVVAQVEADVRASLAELERARSALTLAKQAASLGEDALALSALAYREGATSNIEVVDAERRARDAQTAAAAADDAYRQAALDLLIAEGRFPPPRPARPARR